MVTSKGTLTIALDAIGAPLTTNSFVFLARYHYFDGIVFHRIIPGFVCQGGDPTGSGRGGPGYQFSDELPSPGRYEIGSLAMANAGPNTNGSQFFVISGPSGAACPRSTHCSARWSPGWMWSRPWMPSARGRGRPARSDHRVGHHLRIRLRAGAAGGFGPAVSGRRFRAGGFGPAVSGGRSAGWAPRQVLGGQNATQRVRSRPELLHHGRSESDFADNCRVLHDNVSRNRLGSPAAQRLAEHLAWLNTGRDPRASGPSTPLAQQPTEQGATPRAIGPDTPPAQAPPNTRHDPQGERTAHPHGRG